MGRFPNDGRGGRFSQQSRSPPRYLSMPPPLLRFKAPDLSSNPFFQLSSQYKDNLCDDNHSDKSVHNDQVIISKSIPTNNLTPDLNKKRSSNVYTSRRKISPMNPNALERPTANSPILHTLKLSPTSVCVPNSIFPSPHKIVSSIAQPALSTGMSIGMSTETSPSTSPPILDSNMGDPSPPCTPDKGRRDKKSRQRDRDSESTPSKKRCDSNSPDPKDDIDMDDTTETQHEPPASTRTNNSDSNSIKRYVRITSAITEATLRNMSNENLLKELVATSKRIGANVTFDSIKTLPKPVLIQRALEFRHKLKSLQKNTSFRILASTSADEINSLSPEKAISAYVASLKSRSMPVIKNDIDQLSHDIILKNLIAYRDSLYRSLLDKKQFPTTNDQTTACHENPAHPTSKNESTDIDRYTSVVHDNSKNPGAVPPIGNPTNPFKTISQRLISIRTKWYRDHFKKPNIELVREIVRIVRECDSEMHLIPSVTNSQLKIFHEDAINNDIIYNYLWNNSTNDKTMKQFTLQFYIKVHPQEVSKKIIEYMSKTKNYGKVDHINSDKIACVGFFNNFHPEHHHRERLRQYCVDFIKSKHNTEVQLSIFPRQISAGRGFAKTATRAVVCEVSEDNAQLVTTALMQCDFNQYTEVKFIPFTRFDSTYTEMLCKIIDAHRKFLQNIEIIRIPRMYLTHDQMKWKTDQYSSVRDLILACNGTEPAFLRDVDVGSNFSVNILYYISQEEKLPPFLSNLQQRLCDHIAFDALQTLYQYQGSLPALLNRRRMSQFEREYILQLKQEYKVSNPQESPPPKHPIVKAWVPSPPQPTPDSTIEDLVKRLQTIESNMEKLTPSGENTSHVVNHTDRPNENLDSIVSSKVKAAASELRTEFQTKFETITKQVNTVEQSLKDVSSSTTKLENSISKLEETQTKLETTNSRLLAFLEKNYNLPASGLNDEPRANI